jgi:hypothetical protein
MANDLRFIYGELCDSEVFSIGPGEVQQTPVYQGKSSQLKPFQFCSLFPIG